MQSSYTRLQLRKEVDDVAVVRHARLPAQRRHRGQDPRLVHVLSHAPTHTTTTTAITTAWRRRIEVGRQLLGRDGAAVGAHDARDGLQPALLQVRVGVAVAKDVAEGALQKAC
jgi:hypothetical protein